METSGALRKMKTTLTDTGLVQYELPLVTSGENGQEKRDFIPLNDMIGKKVSLTWNQQIFDIHDGGLIKKSYGQGYSYKNFIKLPECDSCIVKPELCHFHQGTCRDDSWGKEHCFIPHVIYLSVTSGVKVGITRHTQVPTRWIDQGAVKAIAVAQVSDRKTSGLLEVEIAKEMADKTNWRNMLKGQYEDVDLEMMREQIYESYGDLLDDMDAEEIEDGPIHIQYPIESVPDKITSFSFDKKPLIEGTLTGIKGQYFIFDNGVINIRKHQGYHITINAQ